MPKKPPKTHRETALDFSANGRAVAACIEDAIWQEKPPDYRFCFAYAHRLRRCNDHSNIWLAVNYLVKETGEVFDASGRFWHCGLKLCPYCIALSARRARRILRQALADNPSPPNPSPKFVTLTIKNPSLPILETRAIVNHAWALYRKRSWFKENILGGSKSEEFTVTKNGYHWHIHCLWQSNYISYHDARANWTSAALRAHKVRGFNLDVQTRDGMLIMQVKSIRDLKTIDREVCKYITKSDSWKNVPMSDLLNIVRIPRWPRMFELFGSWKGSSGSLSDEERCDESSIVHTSEITDAASRNWRETCTAESVADYFAQQHSQIIDSTQYRIEYLKASQPVATFSRLRYNANPNVERNATNQVMRYERMNARPTVINSFADLDQQTANFHGQ